MTRPPYVYTGKRRYFVPCCPRCGGAYESALHRICAAELRRAEEAQGWR